MSFYRTMTCGRSEFYIETTRRFAHHGYLAICANLYEREGGRVMMGKEELNAKTPVAPIDMTKELACPPAQAVRQRLPRAEGMAKRGDEWFPLSQAVVAYDHARHAPLGDVITLDFINTALEPGARAGIELTLKTAKEAEVRGKGAALSLVQAA